MDTKATNTTSLFYGRLAKQRARKTVIEELKLQTGAKTPDQYQDIRKIPRNVLRSHLSARKHIFMTLPNARLRREGRLPAWSTALAAGTYEHTGEHAQQHRLQFYIYSGRTH